MSMGGAGSNYSTGATGETPSINTPPAPTASAPSGGKGGYDANPNPYSQQQPQQSQIYMPPPQPTFYDQAFSQPNYRPYTQSQPQMTSFGLGNRSGGNAYARQPFNSYAQPNSFYAIGAPPPHDLDAPISPAWRLGLERTGGPGAMLREEPLNKPASYGPVSSGGLGSLAQGFSNQQNPAMAQYMNPLERQRAMVDTRLNEMLPSGLTRRQQNAGWRVDAAGNIFPAGI